MVFFSSPLAIGATALLSVVFISALFASSSRKKRYESLGAGPPRVLHSYIYGLDVAIDMLRAVSKHKFYDWTKKILDTNKHTVELRMLGAVLLLTDDPENIKAVQDTQFTEVAKSKEQHEIFKHILGDAIFALNGDEWKAEAALLKAHMSRVRPSDFETTERHLNNAFKLLENEELDAFDVLDRLQLDIVTEVFTGECTNSLTSDQSPFRSAMDTLLKIASFRQLMGKVGVYIKDDWLAPKAVKEIDTYLDRFADRAFARDTRGKKPESLTLIDDLIQKGKARQDIKNAVTATLLAGKDPTTTTLGWAYYEIARHPEVYARMRAEVKEFIGFDRLPVMSDLHNLKYIRIVIKETLRHHHPLGYNARVPVKDMTLPRGGGPDGKSPVAVLKGTQIVYNLLSLGHRNDLGTEDIDTWWPERWESWKPQSKWDFIPFNHGPRICIGQQFANFQMEYFFARLCQEFETITLLPKSLPQEGLVKLELNTKMAYPVFTKSVRRAAVGSRK